MSMMMVSMFSFQSAIITMTTMIIIMTIIGIDNFSPGMGDMDFRLTDIPPMDSAIQEDFGAFAVAATHSTCLEEFSSHFSFIDLNDKGLCPYFFLNNIP